MSFQIMIIDNFAAPGDGGTVDGPSFDTYDEAVLHCRALVNHFLEHNWEVGMSSEDLWKRFALFGHDPVVWCDETRHFSGWEYARMRCKELCRL